MHLKNIDLMLVVSIVVLNVLVTFSPYKTPVIGIIVSLPLVFVLPGYVLTEALFHKRTLDVAHRLTSSLALSLAIVIVSGFILNILPSGLHAISWSIFLGSLTLLFSLRVALIRRKTVANEERFPKFHFPAYGYALFGLAIIVTIFSVQYSANGVVQQPHPGFTQLWMLPSKQMNNSWAIHLGVQNFEATSMTYRVTMTINGSLVESWPSIVLVPKHEWSQFVPLNSRTTNNMYVAIQLYRLDKPSSVYRNVSLLLHPLIKSKLTEDMTNYAELMK